MRPRLLLCVLVSATSGGALQQQFHVAPMQCYTNKHLRLLFRLLSKDVHLWTEMEKVDELLTCGKEGWRRRFGHNEGDVTLQVGGNDPSNLSQCLHQISDMYKFREVNLNCGCPSIESGGAATYGASLMKQPELTGRLLQSMRETVPDHTAVSIKCRVAVLDDSRDLDGFDACEQYDDLHRYIRIAEESGVSHVVLHARPAILSGLSPVKNRQVPSLDYDIVERVARDFPALQVTLNGGITSLSDLHNLQNEANGAISSYMAGRWMLRRPLDLALVSSHEDDNCNDRTTIRAVERYFETIRRDLSAPLMDTCLPLYLISEQLREDYDAYCAEDYGIDKKPSLSEDEFERLYETMVDGLDQIEGLMGEKSRKKLTSCNTLDFKKLSTSLKGLVGTKVTNKWKRNRSEI